MKDISDKRVNISLDNPSIHLIKINVMNAVYVKIFANLMLEYMDLVKMIILV